MIMPASRNGQRKNASSTRNVLLAPMMRPFLMIRPRSRSLPRLGRRHGRQGRREEQSSWGASDGNKQKLHESPADLSRIPHRVLRCFTCLTSLWSTRLQSYRHHPNSRISVSRVDLNSSGFPDAGGVSVTLATGDSLGVCSLDIPSCLTQSILSRQEGPPRLLHNTKWCDQLTRSFPSRVTHKKSWSLRTAG